MNTPQPFKKPFNIESFQQPIRAKEIPLIDNFEGIESTADLRLELSRLGLSSGSLSEDDCLAILQHAAKIMEATADLTQDTAISEAYIDRLAKIGSAGIALFKTIPVTVLQDIFESKFGRPVSAETISDFIRRFESGNASVGESTALAEWIKELQSQSAIETEDLNYVVEQDGRVAAIGRGDRASLQAKALSEKQEGLKKTEEE